MSTITTISVIAYVAPSSTGYGIRLRASRTAPGVWMAEGWPENAPEGASATKEGYRWEKAEDAEAFLTKFVNENIEHGHTSHMGNGVIGWH